MNVTSKRFVRVAGRMLATLAATHLTTKPRGLLTYVTTCESTNEEYPLHIILLLLHIILLLSLIHLSIVTVLVLVC